MTTETAAFPATALCLSCGGEARQRDAVSLGQTRGVVYHCTRCEHRHGAFYAGPGDPPETVTFVRRKLAKMASRHPNLMNTEAVR